MFEFAKDLLEQDYHTFEAEILTWETFREQGETYEDCLAAVYWAREEVLCCAA